MEYKWIDAIGDDHIDWARIELECPYAADMRSCVQDPVHHAEGDVLTHTRMVADAMATFGLSGRSANLTAFFHDVEKPFTREVIDGRVSHPKHARLGAQTAWHDLWRAGVSLDTRLRVFATIHHHQKIFHIWSSEDEDEMIFRLHQFVALGGDWSSLIAFARADNAGRICADPQAAVDNLDLLSEFIADRYHEMLPEDRFRFVHRRLGHQYAAFPDPRGSRVIVMSGLPGAGKTTRIGKAHAGVPVVSLDDVRADLGVKPTHNQGRVIQEAFERAKRHLRKREPFVWDATCISKLARGKIIKIATDYDAHVTIEAFDRPLDMLLRQNRERDQAVPDDLIRDLSRKWEPPTLAEAHAVVWV